MGLKGMVDDFTGKTGAAAAKQASFLQQKGMQESMDRLTGGYDSAMANYDPYIQGGMNAYNNLVSGSTPEGYAKSLETLNQSPAIQQLISMKERSMGNQLSSVGLGRSGYGVSEMSAVSPETLMALENSMYGRQSPIANTGYSAMGARTGMDIDKTNALAQMIMQKYGIKASGVLGAAEARAKGASNVVNTGMQLLGTAGQAIGAVAGGMGMTVPGANTGAMQQSTTPGGMA